MLESRAAVRSVAAGIEAAGSPIMVWNLQDRAFTSFLLLVLIASSAACQSTSRTQDDAISPDATADASAQPHLQSQPQPQDAASLPRRASIPPAGDTETIVLHVYGMSCPLCATNVDKQLLKIDGVNSVRVNLNSGEVIVFTSKDNPPRYDQLARAVEESGFTLVEKNRANEPRTDASETAP